jgi:predicted metal-binding membrane protein
MTAAFLPGSVRSRVGVGLIAVTVTSWAYLLLVSTRMGDMHSSLAMPMTSAWTVTDAVLMWVMWAVMMVGMMLASAAPMISAYAKTARSHTPGIHASTGSFVASYLAVWTGFAAIATGAQWLLHGLAVVDMMGATTNHRVGGLILLAAGGYQFTSFKNACLRQCRSPLGFLLREWRDGKRGAIIMGAKHGTLCVGCCWALMAMLFVLGVMNLWWVALITAVVLVEKVLPFQAFSRLLGLSLAGWGAALTVGLGH